MMERLEALFDVAVDASLEAVGSDYLDEQLRRYLADARAIEGQAIALLERGPKLAGNDRLAHIYEEHLAESRDHCELVAERLHALGGDPSTLKDAALRLGGRTGPRSPRPPRHTGEARRVRAGVRAPRDRRLRAAQARGRSRGRPGERRACGPDPRGRAPRAERVADMFGEAVDASLDAVGASATGRT